MPGKVFKEQSLMYYLATTHCNAKIFRINITVHQSF
jgi:hypothetical protein